MPDYQKKTVVELTEILKARALPHSGKKAELVARLNEADRAADEAQGESCTSKSFVCGGCLGFALLVVHTQSKQSGAWLGNFYNHTDVVVPPPPATSEPATVSAPAVTATQPSTEQPAATSTSKL